MHFQEVTSKMRNYAQRVQVTIIGILAAISMSGFKQEEKPELVSEITVVKSETVYQISRSIGIGRVMKAKVGNDGTITKFYRLIRKDGKVVGKDLVREERIEMTPTVYYMGKGGYTPSRGGSSFRKLKTLTMRASAYEPGPRSNGKWAFTTAMGIRPRYGIVAVDPRTIKLGSLLYVEGYGFAYAADTGSAIKGDRIDLCYATEAQCRKFGRKKVTVHVITSK